MRFAHPSEASARGQTDIDGSRTTALSTDKILGGQLVLRQPLAGDRVSIDAVFAAAAVAAKPGEHVLDAGSGSGAIALCIARRVAGTVVHGIEADCQLVDLANENAKLNQLSAMVSFTCRDVMAGAADADALFDHVVTNPPFYPAGRGRLSPNPARARAHAERRGSLSEWVAGCQRRLREGGTITAIFPTERLDELLHEFSRETGSLRVFPLWPKTGKAAKRVIVQGRRGGKASVQLLGGLVLHRADGRYTARAEKILRGGGRLVVPR